MSQHLPKLGESWDVPDDIIDQLNAFTCAIYGRAHTNNVDSVRPARISGLVTDDQPKNVYMASLPPCKKTLVQHIKRVNFQVAIWKQAHIPEPRQPLPTVGHGWVLCGQCLEPLWYDGLPVPQVLADIAESTDGAESDGTESDEESDNEDDFMNLESDSGED